MGQMILLSVLFLCHCTRSLFATAATPPSNHLAPPAKERYNIPYIDKRR